MIDLFLIPLGPYVLVTAGALACLYVFFSLKKEVQELRVRCVERNTRQQGMLEDLERRMEDLNREARRNLPAGRPPEPRSRRDETVLQKA